MAQAMINFRMDEELKKNVKSNPPGINLYTQCE